MSTAKARAIIRSQLRRSISGSSGGQKAHIRRAEHISEAIYKRFGVMPSRWQVKHGRWFLAHEIHDRAPGTRYHYYRTLRLIAENTLDRWDDWEPLLRGPWMRPGGDGSRVQKTGRPRL